MRFVAGLKGTAAVALTKTLNVGVALVLICVCTVGAGATRHCPFCGFVSHSVMVNGRLAVPVFAETVSRPGAPTFTAATAKAPALARRTMPSFGAVAAKATMSGAGCAVARRRKVLTPEMIGAGELLAHAKLS